MAEPPPAPPGTDIVNADRLYGASVWPPNDCNLIVSGDTAWVLTSTALVLFMTPGLAFFYGGLVHRKSVLTIIMQCMISLGTTSVLWFLIGFSLGFGESAGHIIGNPASYPLLLNLDPCTPAGFPMAGAQLTIPGLLFAGYQMMFAIISPALITGAFADRVQFPAYLIFISLWVILVYCPFVHWIWNAQGFLAQWGVKDFAGGIVVHISAGFAALASVFYVGTRRYLSDEERMIAQVPHNRTFVALGAGMLWFGWFGFNGGSALGANGQAVFALVNSSIAAATAMCLWVGIEWVHMGKPSLVGACIGCVAGLATITPCAGFIRPWAAFLIGIMAGPVCYGCVEFRKLLGWDDALDVWGVHGMGGFLGSVMLGALGDTAMGAPRSGLFFGKQLAACIGCAAYTFVISYALLYLINFITPVNTTDEQIREGLDASLHGEHAYDDDAIKQLVGGALLDKIDQDSASTEDDRIANVFKQFDEDRNGALSAVEFKSAVRQLGVVVDNATLDKMLNEADKDRNGSLDKAEFTMLVKELKKAGSNRNGMQTTPYPKEEVVFLPPKPAPTQVQVQKPVQQVVVQQQVAEQALPIPVQQVPSNMTYMPEQYPFMPVMQQDPYAVPMYGVQPQQQYPTNGYYSNI